MRFSRTALVAPVGLVIVVPVHAATRFLSSIPVEGIYQSVALAGDQAYVADHSNLRVYGIADAAVTWDGRDAAGLRVAANSHFTGRRL